MQTNGAINSQSIDRNIAVGDTSGARDLTQPVCTNPPLHAAQTHFLLLGYSAHNRSTLAVCCAAAVGAWFSAWGKESVGAFVFQ